MVIMETSAKESDDAIDLSWGCISNDMTKSTTLIWATGQWRGEYVIRVLII